MEQKLVGRNRRIAAYIGLATALLYPFSSSIDALPALPKLKTETQRSFDRYLEVTDTRNDNELRQGHPFLWIDGLGEEERRRDYAALKSGEIKLTQLETLDGGSSIRCPHGIIHHWAGVAFIPGAKLDDVLGVLQDYDLHSTYYAPDVESSKLESRDGDHFRASLRFRRHKVITVVLNTEHDVHYFRDSAERAHSRSSAFHIGEVENAGEKNEKEKAPGDDSGFMWRMETWWRMEESDGGVYVQSEVVSLTRDIPVGLGWLIEPFVKGIPKESLTFTLNATRAAVTAKLKLRN
jgi:hypothetical protein